MTRSVRQEGGLRLSASATNISPIVSIIIVVFRARQELHLLLESIFRSATGSFEVIVVDGASDDGSIDVLRKWSDKITYWLSEPDSGIYDAMNKGLAAARGEYVWHLNAGDRLRKIPWQSLERCSQDDTDLLSCCVLMDSTTIFTPRTGYRLLIENTWHHQGTFYRRTSHLGYNVNYRVYGDFDLNQRTAKAGLTVTFSNEVVADHRNDGVSVVGKNLHWREYLRIVGVNSGPLFVPAACFWLLLLPLRTGISRWRHRNDNPGLVIKRD